MTTTVDREEGAGWQASLAAADGMFASLRLRNFRLLLVGTTLTNAAQWLQQVTLGWLAFDMTGSGAVLGSVNAMRAAATLTVTPFAGAAIDRIHGRALVLFINGWLLAISLTLGLALVFGHSRVWYLYAFMFLGGAAQAVDVPLRQTLVFTLVPRQLTPNALALVQTGWGVMRSLGPAAGGFLILWFGPGGNFLIQAGAYSLIALNIVRIRFPPKQSAHAPGTSFLSNLGEGLRYVGRERVTRTFLLMGWVMPLLIIPNFTALTPIYAKEKFAGGPEVLGTLMAAVGVGGIAGGLVTASLGRVDRRGLVQVGALLLLSLSLLGFVASPKLAVGWLMFASAGFFEIIFLTGNQTLLQLSIPDELRGRVTSITTLTMAMSPLGALYAGAASDVVGAGAVTAALASTAALTAVFCLLFVPTVRDYSIRAAIEDNLASRG